VVQHLATYTEVGEDTGSAFDEDPDTLPAEVSGADVADHGDRPGTDGPDGGDRR
jgi:hypothetical protein